MFGSVCLSVCLGLWNLNCAPRQHTVHYVHAAEWSILGFGSPSAAKSPYDKWNTVQDLCVCQMHGMTVKSP